MVLPVCAVPTKPRANLFLFQVIDVIRLTSPATPPCTPLRPGAQCGGRTGDCGIFCDDMIWLDRCCPRGHTCVRSNEDTWQCEKDKERR